ncbi:MAG: hypothetical protein NVS3B26_18990 [Mycobacteriales bacterium]
MKAVIGLVGLLVLGACASPAGNAADVTFVSQMLPHHAAALAAARLAAEQGSDPRVRAFGERVLAEQTPEVARMKAVAVREHLHLDLAAGSAHAMQKISATELARLAGLRGTAFDRAFLMLSVRSEQGAAQMARTELAGGHVRVALMLAKSIASAPSGEIPELQALLAEL